MTALVTRIEVATAWRSARERLRRGVWFVAFGLGAALPLRGQDSTSLSVETSIGGGYGFGGSFVNRGALASDVSLALRLHQGRGGGMQIGVARDWQSSVGHDQSCLVAPGGGCVPSLPAFSWAAVLIGWEEGRAPNSTVRVLGGPAYYWSGDRSAIGEQARLEFATSAPFRIALVGFARGDVIPRRVAGNTLALCAIGVGLRIE